MIEEIEESGPDPASGVSGVMIERTIAEDGSVKVVVQPVGDTRLTEVQTILQLGAREWQSRLGLG